MVSKNTKNEDWTFQIQPKGEPYSKLVFQTQAWIKWHFWSLRFERVRNSPHTPLPPLPPRHQWLRIWRSGKLEKITMQIEFEKMKLNHINTALFSVANLHTPCRWYMFFHIFPSFSPDVNGDIVKVAVHVFITMIRHHHLIICVLLLPYSSSFPRSSSAVATLVSYWFSIFVSKVHFFQQEIYVCLQRFVFQTII